MVVKGRTTTRARTEKPKNFLWIRIMKVSKCSAGSDHAARAELIGKFRIRCVREPIRERRNYRRRRNLCRTINWSSGEQVGLVVHVRALLKRIVQAGCHVWAQTVLEINHRILIGLVASTRSL